MLSSALSIMKLASILSPTNTTTREENQRGEKEQTANSYQRFFL